MIFFSLVLTDKRCFVTTLNGFYSTVKLKTEKKKQPQYKRLIDAASSSLHLKAWQVPQTIWAKDAKTFFFKKLLSLFLLLYALERNICAPFLRHFVAHKSGFFRYPPQLSGLLEQSTENAKRCWYCVASLATNDTEDVIECHMRTLFNNSIPYSFSWIPLLSYSITITLGNEFLPQKGGRKEQLQERSRE